MNRCEIDPFQNARLKVKYNYPGFDFSFFLPQLIRVSTRTGIPLDVLPPPGLTAKQAERMSRINDADLPRVSTQPRDRQESREERRARKQAVKEERKVRSRRKSISMFLKSLTVTEPKLK